MLELKQFASPHCSRLQLAVRPNYCASGCLPLQMSRPQLLQHRFVTLANLGRQKRSQACPPGSVLLVHDVGWSLTLSGQMEVLTLISRLKLLTLISRLELLTLISRLRCAGGLHEMPP